ncbi:MAG: hypothetical protein D6723_09070 [Acidobacteria bacterium]|nr:MAG: hypothetical protein D6723_09070 [Acidobacteriota bacterium]
MESIGALIQREPRPGESATEPTEVKLLYDRQNLYIGVMCYDSEPERIIATQMARDADLSADDRIEILIDTFHDRRNAFYFATNPAGALVDALITENGQFNKEWDAIWNVRTHRSDRGWSAEFAIPFKSLSFKRGQRVWGFNISRTIKRKLEEDRWAAPRLDVRFFQVSEAGEIYGLIVIEQGRGLDVRPFFSGKGLHSGDSGHNATNGKGGVDIFYNLTPNLKLTTTLNTDFAETEVDARQINLTRFPLFFPEKRAFFLENAGVFNFSDLSAFFRRPDLIPFFSRRIGLLRGQEVPISVGTKLTGKAGRYDIGALWVRTRATDAVTAKNFFVARVKRNIFTQSYIGGIFTDGDPANPTSSRTFGADLRLATSNFLGRERNFEVNTYWLKTSNEGVEGPDNSFGFSVRYPNDLLNLGISWRQIERNFRPALGFVSRTDVRKLNLSAVFSPRPKHFLNIRQMFHEVFFTRFTRLDKGRVESWRLFTAPINWRFNSGDRIEFNYMPVFERLFEPFEISEGVILPPGDYRFTRWRAEFGTASKRSWRIEGTWWFGTYWSGRADQIETSFQYKLAPHLRVTLDTEQTFARLKEGRFVARIFSLRADYSVSPFLTFFNLVQFDNESRNLGWQSRVRWILRPGNELFLVFNQGYLQDERGGFHFRPTDTKLAVKFQYTFRF